MTVLCCLSRFNIRINIGSPKPIYGLFRITDQKKPMRLGQRKNPMENFPLKRIGILEFINQGSLIFLLNRFGQRPVNAFPLQNQSQTLNQIII